MENPARYVIRASFSQERMQYLANEGTVIYAAKDGNDRKVFDAKEWFAAMCSHVPNRGEHCRLWRSGLSLEGIRIKQNALFQLNSIL